MSNMSNKKILMTLLSFKKIVFIYSLSTNSYKLIHNYIQEMYCTCIQRQTPLQRGSQSMPLYQVICVYSCTHTFCEVSVKLLMCRFVPVVLVNKDELTPKMRPMSNDAGSSNPNVSDLMDEFIQERLRARGTSVCPYTHSVCIVAKTTSS